MHERAAETLEDAAAKCLEIGDHEIAAFEHHLAGLEHAAAEQSKLGGDAARRAPLSPLGLTRVVRSLLGSARSRIS